MSLRPSQDLPTVLPLDTLLQTLNEALDKASRKEPALYEALPDTLEESLWLALDRQCPDLMEWGTCQVGNSWRMHMARYAGQKISCDFNPDKGWEVQAHTFSWYIARTPAMWKEIMSEEALLKAWEPRKPVNIARGDELLISSLCNALEPLKALYQEALISRQTPELSRSRPGTRL